MRVVILQSHYPNRRSTDGRWLKFLETGVCTDFGWFFGRPTTFCRCIQIKSFVDRPADFHRFCHRWNVGRWSTDSGPTFWRNLHHDIDRRSPDHRASIGRWSSDCRPMTFYQRTVDRRRISAVILPMITRLSADHNMWFVLYFYYACTYIICEI